MKKIISVMLVLSLLFLTGITAFAEELKSLDTSAVNGRVTTYVGVEENVVIYPEPLEAEAEFDVREATITCSKEGIVSVRPEKVEEYRFGSVLVKGLKKGSTVVTVTAKNGVSCKFKVTVRAKIWYDIQNFRFFLDYLPYYIGMAILNLFGGIR